MKHHRYLCRWLSLVPHRWTQVRSKWIKIIWKILTQRLKGVLYWVCWIFWGILLAGQNAKMAPSSLKNSCNKGIPCRGGITARSNLYWELCLLLDYRNKMTFRGENLELLCLLCGLLKSAGSKSLISWWERRHTGRTQHLGCSWISPSEGTSLRSFAREQKRHHKERNGNFTELLTNYFGFDEISVRLYCSNSQ